MTYRELMANGELKRRAPGLLIRTGFNLDRKVAQVGDTCIAKICVVPAYVGLPSQARSPLPVAKAPGRKLLLFPPLKDRPRTGSVVSSLYTQARVIELSMTTLTARGSSGSALVSELL